MSACTATTATPSPARETRTATGLWWWRIHTKRYVSGPVSASDGSFMAHSSARCGAGASPQVAYLGASGEPGLVVATGPRGAGWAQERQRTAQARTNPGRVMDPRF